MGLKLIKLLEDLIATIGAAKTTGTHIGIALLLDVLELVAVARYIRALSVWEAYVLEVFEEELIRAAEHLAQAAEDEDPASAQRARDAAAAGTTPHGVDGSWGLYDEALLAGSGLELIRLGIPQTVFEAVTAGEVVEVAEVVALL